MELGFKHIELVKVPDSLFDAASYWHSFSSSTPDLLLENFSRAPGHVSWRTDGPKETVQRLTFPVEAGDTCLRVDYELYPYGSVDAVPESLGWVQDWSKWRALELRGKGFERYSRLAVLLVDSSSEAWVGHVELGADWKSLRLDFSDFRLFEYWQPEDARPNRRLDLEKVKLISLRSMEYGEKGSFAVDGLKLSNAPRPGMGALRKPAVWYDQQGYGPQAVKRALVRNGGAEEFLLLDSNGRKVLAAPLVYNGVWDLTGDSLYHRDIPYPPFTEGSGPYDDSRYADEFFWAQAMLWRATGDSSLQKKLEKSLSEMPAEPSLNWQNTGNLAMRCKKSWTMSMGATPWAYIL